MAAYDVIVIGVGGMGSAACCHLARRGRRVLCIEQFAPAHDRGSSHGQTRILRRSYFEHPAYVPLVDRSEQLWHELERLTDTSCLEHTGLLLVGRPDGPVLNGIRRARDEHRIPLDELDPPAVRSRWAGLNIDDDQQAIFEPGAGFLRVETCVLAHCRLAVEHGATILTGQRVRGWSAAGDSVRVRLDGHEFTAASLVITAGPWSAAILAELNLPLHIRRKVQLWFRSDNAAHDLHRGMPVFAYDLADGFFYGFPAIEPGVIKLAEHTGGDRVDDADGLERDLRSDDLPRVQRFVARYLPGVRPLVERASVCMYTMTPDEHFIIDRHPGHANVVFAAGFSGHGFKFCPVIGSVLADLVIEGQTREPVDFLRLARLRSEPRPSGT